MIKLKSITVIALGIAFIALSSINCDDDKSPSKAHPSALVGTWELTKLTVITADTTEVYDNPATVGLSITLIVNSNGRYQSTETYMGFTETETGTWSATGTTITITVDPPDNETITLPYTLAGDKLTITIVDDGETQIQEFTRQ